MWELFWTVIIVGIPMLSAWLWDRRVKRRAKKRYEAWRKMVEEMEFARLKSELEKENDAQIFKTAEEFRNDSQ